MILHTLRWTIFQFLEEFLVAAFFLGCDICFGNKFGLFGNFVNNFAVKVKKVRKLKGIVADGARDVIIHIDETDDVIRFHVQWDDFFTVLLLVWFEPTTSVEFLFQASPDHRYVEQIPRELSVSRIDVFSQIWKLWCLELARFTAENSGEGFVHFRNLNHFWCRKKFSILCRIQFKDWFIGCRRGCLITVE